MKYTIVVFTLAIMLAASVRALQKARPENAAIAATTVPRYEYCQYFGTYFEDGLMDKFGRQGWDLVSFGMIGERQVNQNFVGAKEYVLTFKRQIGSGLKSCDDSRK
jgi:hypothetical protein